MQAEHAHLECKKGGSDKVYHAHLESEGSGWVVRVEYGPRGGTLVAATKTSSPVSFAEAKKAFDAVVAEKTSPKKGYTPIEAGTPYQRPELEARTTGVLPQLLNPIKGPEHLQQLLADPAWWAQEKQDGHRRMVRKAGGTVTGINRNGLAVALPQIVADAFAELEGDFVVDGELVGDTLHAFDLLAEGVPYAQRLRLLESLGAPNVVRTARTEAEKRQLLADVEAHRGEGVVFKRHAAHRKEGRPNSGGDQLKHKLTQSVSCIVIGTTRGKRSVMLGLHDPDSPVNPVPVGNVTIPPNHEVPANGEVVEVRYLYARRGGSLYQPVYLGPRTDILALECTLAQLKLKVDSGEDDEA